MMQEPDYEWDERLYMVQREATFQGLAGDGATILLEYQSEGAFGTGIAICNLLRSDGLCCRMLAGHEGPHLPVDPTTISETGMYVVERIEP